ncbi:MAG: NAD(P)H-hydrate dehydratase [Candidatus Omnitrophica bacterium]|nr:NAD(P)H-hydrate dehydratase [Candidatus Omnitrophota bacterium]MBU1923474.1 NAD(P)H-hydrate dehydratase [Candidatus Omnitrophota bacterium]
MLRRKLDSHKGDYGHILILAGSSRFSGAALLCAESALRSGAGLVTLGIPKSINLALIRSKPRELITFPLPETNEGTLSLAAFTKISVLLKNIDVLIIGPGLGKNKSTHALVRKIMRKTNQTKVVDADALNALSNYPQILKTHKGQLVLTPHQKEMSRLFGISTDIINNNRKLIAKKYAKHYNSIIILKGHNSIVSDGLRGFYINRSGNPGMATAGSGDVLSGIVGAFLAQGLDGFEAAKYATYIHGLAGDLAVKEKTQMGLIASDIIDRIPDALKKSS